MQKGFIPTSRGMMSAESICDELTYDSYVAQRLNAPEIHPERWASIYGDETVIICEKRFQAEIAGRMDA